MGKKLREHSESHGRSAVWFSTTRISKKKTLENFFHWKKRFVFENARSPHESAQECLGSFSVCLKGFFQVNFAEDCVVLHEL